ncbi:MAG: O-antigen ligase family protein [Bacteroidia bacterium]
MNIIKSIWTSVLMLCYFVLIFHVFDYLPLGFVQDAFTLAMLFLLFGFFAVEFFFDIKNKKISQAHLIIFPILLLPVINCIQSNLVFGQPWYYGFLAQRTNFFILLVSFNVMIIKRGWLTINSLENHFFLAANLCLVIFFYHNLFVDPLKYIDTDLVSYNSVRGYRFKFPNVIINSLLLYCIFKIWISKDRKYYLVLLPVIIYIFAFVKDRSQIVAILLTLLFYYLKNFTIKQRVLYAFSALLTVLVVSVFLYSFFPGIIDTYIELYGNVIKLFAGEQTEEYSTSLRVVESNIAIEGWLQHPWLGTGFLSQQWQNGYFGIYKYFYPADVGILGNLYVYGIIGTLFYYLLFVFAALYSVNLKSNFNVFLVTSQYTMIYIFLDMFTTAINIKFISIIVFFMSIIYYFRFFHKNN